jgi:signal transduction histidine kinase
MTEFVVTDDGPGIPEQFRSRVFGMFQTLRPRDEIEGSGMGLAIVKKLVERQSGAIWLTEGPAGRGLAVHFTWPSTKKV